MSRTQEHRQLLIPDEIKVRKGSIITFVINAAIFIILEIAALNMLRNNGEMQDIWISKGSHAFMSSIWGSTQKIKDYFALGKMNDRLAEENHELRMKLAQFEQIEADTREASCSAHKNIAGNYRYTPAEITKISTGSGHNYFIIDKGSDHGIVEGSGVITGKGAVGIVDAVSRNFSYARSFQNFDMSISARLSKKGSTGPLSWSGKGGSRALLKEIPHHVEFTPGDTVYTSGYSSIFPPDIPLGTAGDARIVNGATYEIDVTLFEDFGALRYVTVVENMGQAEINSLEKR